MSLNWTTAENSPARAAAQDEKLSGLLQAGCFGLMFVGIGKITEENVPEVHARLKFLEALRGAILTKLDPESPGKVISGFEVEDVRRLIGLSVNVAKEPEAKWLKRISSSTLKDWRREAEQALDREVAVTA